MIHRVLFSGTRRSQASPCAFYLAHGEVIVRRVFFLGHGKAIIFFSVYDGRYERATALGFAVWHEKAHGEADNKKSSPALQIFFPIHKQHVVIRVKIWNMFVFICYI